VTRNDESTDRLCTPTKDPEMIIRAVRTSSERFGITALPSTNIGPSDQIFGSSMPKDNEHAVL
jgi:hypothetical protein